MKECEFETRDTLIPVAFFNASKDKNIHRCQLIISRWRGTRGFELVAEGTRNRRVKHDTSKDVMTSLNASAMNDKL
jgi:hypothetical protein